METAHSLRLRLSSSLLALFSISLLAACSGVSTSPTTQPPSTGIGTLAVSPSSLSFGNVAVGSSSSLTGTLSATHSDVTVSSAGWSGSGYSVSGITFPVTVTTGQSTKYTVTFTPPTAGTSPGSISFLSDASDSSVTQSFSGNGAQTQHSAALSWNPSTSSVMGYNIYRGTQSGGPYLKLNPSLITTLGFTDTAAQSGATYYYVATSVDSSNAESAYSNIATAVIP